MFRQTGTYAAVLIAVLLAAVTLWALAPADRALADPPMAADAPADETAPTEPAADEAANGDEQEAVEEPKTFTIEADRLKVETPLDGVFEAAGMFPVSIVPEVWGDLEVLRAVAAGTLVAKGAPILWLDTEDIDRQIADTQAGQELAELQLTQAEKELAFLECSTDRDLDWARRTARIAQEDYDRWMDLTEGYRDQYLPLDEKGIHLRHEAAVEELRQLKEMYEADELIEDTERMILKRN